MTWASVVLIFLWAGVTAYALFGGADFGGGLWDLLAGNATTGERQRARIEKSIGPVWEANHVWLIFALVVLWTAFPQAFAAMASTLYIPFTVAAFGIILRGSSFAFRKEVQTLALRRAFGACFALSSVVTPFAFGTIAGGVASGRVPLAIAGGDVIGSWLNPSSMLGGVLAVCVCAYTAAVFLCADCSRGGEPDLAEEFRRRAIILGLVIAAVGLVGVWILHADAPELFAGLTGRALPVIAASAIAGTASIVLLVKRHYTAVRVTAALAVVTVIAAWGVAQYPNILEPSVTIDQVASPTSTLIAEAIGLGVGAALVLPSLALLFGLFQRPEPNH